MPESTPQTRSVTLDYHKVIQYRVHSVGEYRGSFRQNIIEFKYQRQRHLGRSFGEYIYKNLSEDYDLSDYDFLLPIPSKPSSLSQRGYDHVLLIGQRLSELSRLPLARDILDVLEYPSQMRLNRNERLANVRGKILLTDPSRVIGKNFLVLDDVLTTGATMDEVIRTLNTAGPGRLDDALVLATVPWGWRH